MTYDTDNVDKLSNFVNELNRMKIEIELELEIEIEIEIEIE